MTEEKEQKKYNQRMRQHSYGIDIEDELRKILKINYSSKEKENYMEQLEMMQVSVKKILFYLLKLGYFAT